MFLLHAKQINIPIPVKILLKVKNSYIVTYKIVLIPNYEKWGEVMHLSQKSCDKIQIYVYFYSTCQIYFRTSYKDRFKPLVKTYQEYSGHWLALLHREKWLWQL